jgi:hypothetical protein
MGAKVDFQEIFDAVQMDENAKKVFLSMPREEQLLAILGINAWTRSELAVVKKDVVSIQADLEETRRDLVSYRIKRERQERESREYDDDATITNTQKIAKEVAKALAQRFDFWTWFRDRVLPTVVTIITLAILYFVFGGRIPGMP